jgi:putative Mg2+ transporter-C (MgtC) family protein
MMLSHQLATGPAANIEGLVQVGELGLGLLLSAVIGLEREVRQKSAGLRTHSLVGVGAALFMLVSKYGFSDVLRTGQVIVDPSRVAAQIVTGIGASGWPGHTAGSATGRGCREARRPGVSRYVAADTGWK